MFTVQTPQINQALWLSGLSNQSVAVFQNLIGQCRAPLVHRGPITFDYTQPGMRLILPDSPHKGKPLPPPTDFPPFDPGPGPPDEPEPKPRKRRGPLPPEHGPGEEPPDGFPDVINFNFSPLPFEYEGGPYIHVRNRSIQLRANDRRRHCVFPNGKNILSTVSSVDFKATSSNPEAVDLVITDKPLETTFHLNVGTLAEIRYGKPVTTGYDSTPEVWEKDTCMNVATHASDLILDPCARGPQASVISDVLNVVRDVKTEWVVIGRTSHGRWVVLEGETPTVKREVLIDAEVSESGDLAFKREYHFVIAKEDIELPVTLNTTEVTAVECISLASEDLLDENGNVVSSQSSLSAARKKFFAFMASDASPCNVGTTECGEE